MIRLRIVRSLSRKGLRRSGYKCSSSPSVERPMQGRARTIPFLEYQIYRSFHKRNFIKNAGASSRALKRALHRSEEVWSARPSPVAGRRPAYLSQREDLKARQRRQALEHFVLAVPEMAQEDAF